MYGPLREEATRIFQEEALGGPRGRIGRNIVASPVRSFGRPGFILSSTYRTPSGFDPLPVTRFGHRRKFIVPSQNRMLASTIATKKRRAAGRRAALRITSRRQGGGFYFRYRVPAYKVTGDWVARAHRLLDPALDEAAQNIGRRVTASIRFR
jgi:hypothetical protein